MTEMKILPGKHCKKDMDMRIIPVDDKKKIFGWMIYGICEKCKTVIMTSIFMQEEEPIQEIDFTVDYTQEAVGTKSTEDIRKALKTKGEVGD